MGKIKQVSQLNEVGIRALNEDQVLCSEDAGVFGVFDGASSLNKFTTPDGKTGGYIAAHIAAETFENENEDLAATAIKANQNIEDYCKKLDVSIASAVDRFGTTAAVIKIRNDTVDLLQIADSVIVIIYKDGRVDVPLGYHDHDLDVMRKWRELADAGKSNIRDIVADDVLELRRAANVTYGVLNGDANVRDFIATTTLDLSTIETILLLTDGMYIPKQDPEQDENWNDYAKLYKEGGLHALYTTVRELELADPQLTKYPRYKLHDDASAIAIDFI